ncbi:hypothetical protein AVEN_195083-1 [Araneus ventricosus]|uniref:Uncharacterized protein n=1 Tax=Araneus ventricosus TaxID=182803 RepID=A0A4Y2BHZ0_ARAVE|nr:hypothetical protein AVEN_195083-1 [Araneus ventricosus]
MKKPKFSFPFATKNSVTNALIPFSYPKTWIYRDAVSNHPLQGQDAYHATFSTSVPNDHYPDLNNENKSAKITSDSGAAPLLTKVLTFSPDFYPVHPLDYKLAKFCFIWPALGPSEQAIFNDGPLASWKSPLFEVDSYRGYSNTD